MDIVMKLREVSGDFVNFNNQKLLELVDHHGHVLPGIRGKRGVKAIRQNGEELGVDLIEMDPGSRFPLHVHPGDHILYILQGYGGVVINGEEHPVGPGESIFIAAEYPHGVQGPPSDYTGEQFRFLAVGVPHMDVASKERMTVVEEGYEGN